MSKTETWENDFARLFTGRKLAGRKDDEFVDTRDELADLKVRVPEALVRFCASLDEGEDRLDLTALGGQAAQELCDGYGLAENNDPEEGTFGTLQTEGKIPAGLVMFGYGPTQLVWDTSGVLGAAGGIWQLEDMDAGTAKLLAPDLDGLLAAAQGASL